jgi:hypothetical protein
MTSLSEVSMTGRKGWCAFAPSSGGLAVDSNDKLCLDVVESDSLLGMP